MHDTVNLYGQARPVDRSSIVGSPDPRLLVAHAGCVQQVATHEQHVTIAHACSCWNLHAHVWTRMGRCAVARCCLVAYGSCHHLVGVFAIVWMLPAALPWRVSACRALALSFVGRLRLPVVGQILLLSDYFWIVLSSAIAGEIVIFFSENCLDFEKKVLWGC